jgi:cyclic di-GMP phosphodiesterase
MESSQNPQATILIVEDEEGPRESLKMVLSPHFNLYSVDNAEVAMNILKEQDIDLVTLDLKLPGQQGMDLLQKIRDEGRDTEVVIITGYGTLESAVNAIQHGIAAYITKPFNIPDLLGVIHKALDRRRQVDTLRGSLEAFSSLWVPQGEPASLTEKLRTLLGAKNPELAQHAQRVHYYTSLLLEHMDIPAPSKEGIQLGALLHDIGQLGLQGRLALGTSEHTTEEKELLACHPVIGERMLQSMTFPEETRAIIRSHHERYDGTGFPDQLQGDAISLAARIVGIANTFDNLVSGGIDAAPVTVPEAREHIRREAGKALDPSLAELFANIVG